MLRPGGGAGVHRQLARAADVQPAAVRILLDGGDLRGLRPREQTQMRGYLQAALRNPATPASARPALGQHAQRLAVAMDPGQHAARLARVYAREGDRVATARLDRAEALVAALGHRTRELRVARLDASPYRAQAIYADIFAQHSAALRLLGEAGGWTQSTAVAARAGRTLAALSVAIGEALAHPPLPRRR